MSDASIAAIARRLAEALAKAGRERGDAWKAVYVLQVELCTEYRAELEREAAGVDMSAFEFRIVDHTVKLGEKTVEIWCRGEFVATLYGFMDPGGAVILTVVSERIMSTAIDPTYPTSVLIGLTLKEESRGQSH